MQEEYSSIMKNDVWEVVPRPEGKSVVTSRWPYKVKHAADGSIEKFKARLKKALYGLKQTPRAWYSRIDTYLQGMGFTKSEVDPNLYYIVIGEEPLILVLYADDLIITGVERLIKHCKRDLATEFEMKDIGLMHYFWGTVDYGLDYRHGDGVRLAGYTDSNWAGCASDRKSTSGCCFGLGSAVVSWFNRKQQSVALSSVEAEYMAANLASCEAIWLCKMLFGLFGQPLRPSVIYCVNQSCIKLTENPVFHDRSKHIKIKYYFIRDYVQKGAVKLEYIPIDEQVVNILTKALPPGKHVYFRDKMGVVRNTFLGKREC
eukprot:PITA_29527